MPAQQTAFGYTPLQINLGDWYPMVPPYLSERGWIINQPGHVGEHLAYALADYAREAEAAFEATLQAVTLFNELFGPYPHDTLVLIEADFRNGLEFDGLYFLDRGLYQRHNDTLREYLIPIAVHETAHAIVETGCDQTRRLWPQRPVPVADGAKSGARRTNG